MISKRKTNKAMRNLYIDLIKIIYFHAKENKIEELPDLLVVINHENSPKRDQDVINFLTEFYIYVAFGYRKKEYPEGFKNWAEVKKKIERLEENTSSSPSSYAD